jgi:hypothetical protein
MRFSYLKKFNFLNLKKIQCSKVDYIHLPGNEFYAANAPTTGHNSPLYAPAHVPIRADNNLVQKKF